MIKEVNSFTICRMENAGSNILIMAVHFRPFTRLMVVTTTLVRLWRIARCRGTGSTGAPFSRSTRTIDTWNWTRRRRSLQKQTTSYNSELQPKQFIQKGQQMRSKEHLNCLLILRGPRQLLKIGKQRRVRSISNKRHQNDHHQNSPPIHYRLSPNPPRSRTRNPQIFDKISEQTRQTGSTQIRFPII